MGKPKQQPIVCKHFSKLSQSCRKGIVYAAVFPRPLAKRAPCRRPQPDPNEKQRFMCGQFEQADD